MKTVLHIVSGAKGGGTGKHIDELAAAFPQYEHVCCVWHDAHAHSTENVCLLHVHTIWSTTQINTFQKVSLLRSVRDRGIPVYITIHDHQWIFPSHCTPSSEELDSMTPSIPQIEETRMIFAAASKVIFPSQRVLQNHVRYKGLTDLVLEPNVVVTPHCDIPVRYEQRWIQPIQGQEVRVAFLGHCVPHKGSQVFQFLVHHLPTYKNHRVMYHVFGGQHGTYIPNTHFHGEYDDSSLLHLLRSHGIHILCVLSLAEETYCYTLSRAINSGLPIVYLHRGALANRMVTPNDTSRFFAVHSPTEIVQATQRAIDYVIQNQNTQRDDYVSIPDHAMYIPPWYRTHYGDL